MHKILISFLLFGCLSCQENLNTTAYNAYTNSSLVDIPKLTPQLSENIELLGHVWGFLKYHHPAVTKGNYNWDFELFKILPEYTLTKSSTDRDKLLLDWINSLGEVKRCNSCNTNDLDVKLKPDHSWMTLYNLSKPLSEQLESIYLNRSQGKQHYVKIRSFFGNPIFKNEASYENLEEIDSGYRLLALFRYWNSINYFFPYKHLIGKDWNEVLRAYIPLFLKAGRRLDYELACLQLITEINDSHANLTGTKEVKNWFGVNQSNVCVRFIDNQLVVTDFYDSNLDTFGLKKGDVITHINGDSIGEIIDKLKPYHPASNEPVRLRRIARNILRSNESILNISVKSGLISNSVKLKLYEKNAINYEDWYGRILSNRYRLLDNDIGYLPVVSVDDGEIDDIMEQFEDTKGIIIDLRNYPNTTDVLYKLTPYFMSSKRYFVKFAFGDTNHPGMFKFREPSKFSKNKNYYRGKVIVLVDEYTQSLAEYTAMAYQVGHDVTIIGSKTAGADGEVSYLNLPGNLKTSLTGIGVYYPDGRETQRVGIIPDVEILPTIDSIKDEKDLLLDKAIEAIRNE